MNHTKPLSTLIPSPLTKLAYSSEVGSDNGSDVVDVWSTTGPNCASTPSSCAGDKGDGDDDKNDDKNDDKGDDEDNTEDDGDYDTRVDLFDGLDDIVATASALAGPGDFYDLDQLPLLDPLNPLDSLEPAPVASAAKKRKRAISVLEISDSEDESLMGFEVFSESFELEEPTPKKRNPAQISAYTPNARTVLQLSKQMFKQKVLMNNAFPSSSSRVALGRETWDASRISLPATSAASRTTTFDNNILRILTDVICVTRASVKREASWVVKEEYGLKNLNDIAFDTTPKSALIFNKARIELLQKEYKYIYGTFGVNSDGTLRENVPFAHPSLSLLVYRAVYAQTLPFERGRFDLMPLPLVALAATAMYAALDDWSTGKYVKHSFTTAGYSAHYQHLLAGLQEFQRLRPRRCASLLNSYTEYCKNSDPESELPVLEMKLRVCGSDSEDDSD